MKCEEAREKLAERLEGPLEAVGELKLSAHAEHCPDCAAYERKLLVAWESLTRWSVVETPMARRVQILEAIHGELRRHSLQSLADAAALDPADETAIGAGRTAQDIAPAPIPLKRGTAAVRSAYLTPTWITAIAAALLVLMIPVGLAMFGGNTDPANNGGPDSFANNNGGPMPTTSRTAGPQATPDLDYTPSGSLRPRLTDTPLPMNGNNYDALVALERMTAVDREEFLRNLDLFRGDVNFIDAAALSAVDPDDWKTIDDLDIVQQVADMSWGVE